MIYAHLYRCITFENLKDWSEVITYIDIDIIYIYICGIDHLFMIRKINLFLQTVHLVLL